MHRASAPPVSWHFPENVPGVLPERAGKSSLEPAALNSQALTALRATCVDHFTAARGLHADAKAMGPLAARDGRLISTFHGALTWVWMNRTGRAYKRRKAAKVCNGRWCKEFGFCGTRYLNRFPIDRQ